MKNEEKIYFPMFVNLMDKDVTVIGAGAIATRRITVLSDFTGNITVVAPEISEEVKALEAQGKLRILRKKYEKDDIQKADIVLAVTNDNELNVQIYKDAKELGKLVNVSSDKSLCDFYFPGIVREGSMVAGISASGTAHKKARRIREELSIIMKKVSEED